jgi:hypothetical protein
MTSIAGYNLNTTPCCGATYSTPRYRSMNFMAWEYWTDGYRDGSLMPNDHWLRQCKCGDCYLVGEMQFISQVEETDAPYTQRVASEDLPKAIANARTPEIELAARLDYWQDLNHPYRESYRAHRAAEEAATKASWESDKAAWEAANPDTRSWWQRFRKVPPPQYTQPISGPFTYPPYELSEAQRENLCALLSLHESEAVQIDYEARAELHRELGQFEHAMQALEEKPDDEKNKTHQLLKRLIKVKETAPMRYRM